MNWQPIETTLNKLVPWEHNPKTISKSHAKRLLKLWDELGQFQTIAIGPQGEVYDGHQRLSVLLAAHGPTYSVKALQSERALTEEERAELVIAAHVGTVGQFDWQKLSGWDTATLTQWGMDAETLQGWNSDAANLATMLQAEGAEDEIPSDAIHGGIFTNEQIIDSAFAYFRATGFPYRKLPIHVCMQEINKLAETFTEKLMGTDTGYQVADTYHPHRFHAAAQGMKSPFDSFMNDKSLRAALEKDVIYEKTMNTGYTSSMAIVNGTQAASNFRPGFALYLYRRFAPSASVVLDTSTGYGGRLVGFMASGLDRYIGIDPNVPTHEGNKRMASDLGFSDKVELYNLPAEDVPLDSLRDRCDFSFTSPPYFSKEHYSEDDTQSWVRYKTGEDWRCGFLLPMMRLQYAALRSDSFSIVNIADVKLRNTIYPLVRWTIEAGKEVGFDFVNQEKFELTRRFGAGQSEEVSFEPVLIFRKA